MTYGPQDMQSGPSGHIPLSFISPSFIWYCPHPSHSLTPPITSLPVGAMGKEELCLWQVTFSGKHGM